jgi:hypothetical protein
MLRARFPYETSKIRWVVILLVLMDSGTFALMFSISEPGLIWFRIGFILFMSFITIFVGVSPLLTSHEVHDTHIVIKQGWYYHNRIDMGDIISITRVKEGPYSLGAHFLGNSTIYVNGSMSDLILIELRTVRSINGKKRRMTKVLFDVKDVDGFMRSMGKDFNKVVQRL